MWTSGCHSESNSLLLRGTQSSRGRWLLGKKRKNDTGQECIFCQSLNFWHHPGLLKSSRSSSLLHPYLSHFHCLQLIRMSLWLEWAWLLGGNKDWGLLWNRKTPINKWHAKDLCEVLKTSPSSCSWFGHRLSRTQRGHLVTSQGHFHLKTLSSCVVAAKKGRRASRKRYLFT